MGKSFAELNASLMQDPSYREAVEDAEGLSRLRADLVAIRKAHCLSQSTVAKRMGVGQPTVSEFENSGNDPRVGTLQRYARAVCASLKLSVDLPITASWLDAEAALAWESSAVDEMTTISEGVRTLTRTIPRGEGVVELVKWRDETGIVEAAESRRCDFSLGA